MKPTIQKRKNFRVPNKDIKIALHELLLINNETFQRLNYIKQLGLAYLVYPFALHTRASHCLDCLDKAQMFIDRLKEKYAQIANDEKKKRILERLEEDSSTIRGAALIHDIMHIPFAHTLEDENNLFSRGDKSKRINIMIDKMKEELKNIRSLHALAAYRVFSFRSNEAFDEAFKKCMVLLKDIKKVLWTIAVHDEIEERIKAEKTVGTPSDEIYEKVVKEIRQEYAKKGVEICLLEAERYYIADIVGNTISADLLSYILRDPEFTGIETKPGGWYRLFDYFEIIEDDVGRNRLAIRLTKNGEWRQDAFSTIIRILNVRYDLTEQVTYHHAKLSASAMLGKIVQLIGLKESDELYEVGDEGFFRILKNRIKDIKKGKIENVKKEDVEGAEKLLRCLRCRRLHKRFHVISQDRSPMGINLAEKYSNPEERRKFEMEIEKKFGLLPGSIIIFCPKKKGTLKEAETLVIYEEIEETDKEYSLKPIVAPLNSDKVLDFLKRKGESTAQKVRNVEMQYIDLWKLYVFIDPDIIPIYGYEIKKILNDKLGHSAIFDISFLELSKEYKLSKKISEKMTQMGIVDREQVLKRVPLVIKASRRDSKEEVNIDFIDRNLDQILRIAAEAQMKLE